MQWQVYMVECRDGSLYTGIARDLERRLAAHNAGTGARYTRSRRPVRLVYAEPRSNRGDAQRREAEIKRLSAADKRRLLTPGTETRRGRNSRTHCLPERR